MFPPMRPSPTMPILIAMPLRSWETPSGESLSSPTRHRVEIVDSDAQHPTAVSLEALVVADGLGRDQGPEVIRRTGYLHVRRRLALHLLDGDSAVRAALVELPRGVQEAGP